MGSEEETAQGLLRTKQLTSDEVKANLLIPKGLLCAQEPTSKEELRARERVAEPCEMRAVAGLERPWSFSGGCGRVLACRAHRPGRACQGDGKACEKGSGPLHTRSCLENEKEFSEENKGSTMFIVVTGRLYCLGVMVVILLPLVIISNY